VAWLNRIGRQPAPVAAAVERPSAADAVERVSPGLTALFDRIAEDRSHAVLDLGPASDSSLRVFSRFARWVRFADLLAADKSAKGWAEELTSLPSQPVRPYDLILAWDILDRLDPHERTALVHRLAEISAPDARLYVVVGSSNDASLQSLRFSLLDVDRMRFEKTSAPHPNCPALLPAEVERILEPFHVLRAFTSKVGLREYVAVRRTR